MLMFFVLLFVPLMLQHVVVGGKNTSYEKRSKRALFLFFTMFIVLVMLRHESVGNDTRNYISYFESFAEMSWERVGRHSMEFGFSYFNKIVSLFSKNPQVFLAVAAILTGAMMYPTYKRLCTDASFTIVLFVTMSTFVMMFSGIRQMIAVGIGFIAYDFTRRKKFIWYILAVLVAMSFHISAFMLLALYPVYHAKITRKWLYAVVPALVALFIFNEEIFSILSLLIERYTTYDGTIVHTGAYTMLIFFIILAIFSFVVPNEEELSDEVIGLRNLLLLSVVIQMFAPLHSLAMRMNYYYIIFIPLLLPKIVDCRSEKWGQIAILGRNIMVVFFLIYFFVSKINGEGTLHVFPYHFFWENLQ